MEITVELSRVSRDSLKEILEHKIRKIHFGDIFCKQADSQMPVDIRFKSVDWYSI